MEIRPPRRGGSGTHAWVRAAKRKTRPRPGFACVRVAYTTMVWYPPSLRADRADARDGFAGRRQRGDRRIGVFRRHDDRHADTAVERGASRHPPRGRAAAATGTAAASSRTCRPAPPSGAPAARGDVFHQAAARDGTRPFSSIASISASSGLTWTRVGAISTSASLRPWKSASRSTHGACAPGFRRSVRRVKRQPAPSTAPRSLYAPPVPRRSPSWSRE